ncbi:MAG: hypothetical protein M0R17_02525 [Candidatus Omnitrophica bacterium]|jgi:hypothetical protein|nr:hypothetical protein [Candidatus Omnitrophota bacterium]
MDYYIPDSVLLNTLYLPFYISPVKNIFDCKNNFILESDITGVKSIINLNNIIPYISIDILDSESKDWLWYDKDGFPFRIEKNIILNCWQLKSLYNIGDYKDKILKIDPTKLLYNKNGKNHGFYSLVENYIENDVLIASPTDIKMYICQQIFLTIDGNLITDKTDYINTYTNINLTILNTESNKEFYYNHMMNKIYTNQNLELYDQSSIKIYMYTILDNISVKCNMMCNYGVDNFLTPVVDYYIVKLHGKNIR